MKQLKIACIGEAMIEMIANADTSNAQLGVAGDSMNTAIYLKRSLGPEHEVAFVSMVGQDAFSDRIADFIAGEGVSTELLKRHPSRLPGLYSISTSDTGERSFSYWRDSSAAKMMFTAQDGVKFDELNGFDVVFASAISLAILSQQVRDELFDWVSKFRSTGGTFVFDSNYRPALWPDVQTAQREISRAWSHCDIALPSIDDEVALYDDENEENLIARFRNYGVTSGVMKRGDLGPISLSKNAIPLPVYAKAKNVVDTTAAGDSFNGGFLASFLTTKNVEQAAKAGHDLASHVVSHRGAIVPRNVR